MKSLFSIFIVMLLFHSIILAQNKPLTKGADNGYAWISLSQPINKLIDHKRNYLSLILDNQKLQKLSGTQLPVLFNCDKEILALQKDIEFNSIDLDIIIGLLDEFYSDKDNLIIPVLGAYCYCIKNLAGTDKTELENYRQELINYSKE